MLSSAYGALSSGMSTIREGVLSVGARIPLSPRGHANSAATPTPVKKTLQGDAAADSENVDNVNVDSSHGRAIKLLSTSVVHTDARRQMLHRELRTSAAKFEMRREAPQAEATENASVAEAAIEPEDELSEEDEMDEEICSIFASSGMHIPSEEDLDRLRRAAEREQLRREVMVHPKAILEPKAVVNLEDETPPATPVARMPLARIDVTGARSLRLHIQLDAAPTAPTAYPKARRAGQKHMLTVAEEMASKVEETQEEDVVEAEAEADLNAMMAVCMTMEATDAAVEAEMEEAEAMVAEAEAEAEAAEAEAELLEAKVEAEVAKEELAVAEEELKASAEPSCTEKVEVLPTSMSSRRVTFFDLNASDESDSDPIDCAAKPSGLPHEVAPTDLPEEELTNQDEKWLIDSKQLPQLAVFEPTGLDLSLTDADGDGDADTMAWLAKTPGRPRQAAALMEAVAEEEEWQEARDVLGSPLMAGAPCAAGSESLAASGRMPRLSFFLRTPPSARRPVGSRRISYAFKAPEHEEEVERWLQSTTPKASRTHAALGSINEGPEASTTALPSTVATVVAAVGSRPSRLAKPPIRKSNLKRPSTITSGKTTITAARAASGRMPAASRPVTRPKAAVPPRNARPLIPSSRRRVGEGRV